MGVQVEPATQKKNVTVEGSGNDVSPAFSYALVFEDVQKGFQKKRVFLFFRHQICLKELL